MKCLEVNASTSRQFKQLIGGDKPVVILYRMSLCPHCIALSPIWDNVKEKLKNNTNIALAEVEYASMKILPKSLQNIRGFPTIQCIEKQKVKEEYFGDRSEESIVDFALSHAKPTKPVAVKKPRTTKVAVEKVPKRATNKVVK